MLSEDLGFPTEIPTSRANCAREMGHPTLLWVETESQNPHPVLQRTEDKGGAPTSLFFPTSLFISASLFLLRFSFGAEGVHGFDAGGASGGDEAREGCEDRQHQDCAG